MSLWEDSIFYCNLLYAMLYSFTVTVLSQGKILAHIITCMCFSFLSFGFNFVFFISYFMFYSISILCSMTVNIRQNKVPLGLEEVKLATTVASDKLCTIEQIQVFWDVILQC